MKIKTTFLLFILPFFTFAQGSWEFNTAGNTEGWSATQGSAGASGILTATGTFIRYTTIAGGTNTARNPTFTNPIANMDGTAFNSIQIRVKNGSGATYLRVLADGTSYYSIITAGDIDYKTYTILLNKTGTIVSIAFEFRLNDGTTTGSNYVPQGTTPSTVGTNIDIDYIRPISFVAPVQNAFYFNTTTEGFVLGTRATVAWGFDPAFPSVASLQLRPTVANLNNSKVILSNLVARVDGTNNKYAHITLRNSSTNTLFTLNGVVAGVATAFNPNQTFTASDAAYKTYHFDLSTWTGDQQPELNISVKDTWDVTSTYANGDIVISANTYYKKLGAGNTALNPRLDIAQIPTPTPANWVLVDKTGAEAPAANARPGVALDTINNTYIDQIIFDNVNGVVPTKFGTVYAAAKNKVVEVMWSTYNESNVKGYYVQRSNDGVRFNDLFFVTANNLQESKYDFKDRTISTDAIVYYRIKALDNDGTISFSSVVKINLQNTNSSAISLVNPIKSKTLQMQLNGLQNGNYQVKVQSLEGSLVLYKNLPIQNTSSSVSLSLPSTISKGFYILTVTGNEFRYASKIIIE